MELPTRFSKENAYYRYVGGDSLDAGFVKKEGYRVDWQGGSYPLLSFSVVLRGKGLYVDSRRKRHQLHPGKVFFRIPGLPHATTIDPDSQWLEFFIAFRFRSSPADHRSLCPPSAGTAPGKNGMLADKGKRRIYLRTRHEPEQDDAWVLPMFRHLFGIPELGIVREIDLSLDVLKMCDDFVSLLRAGKDEPTLPMQAFHLIMKLLACRKAQESDQIHEATCRIIRENATNDRRLPEILRGIPLSYSLLRKRFLDTAGRSMGQYRIECRIEEAVNMLLAGRSVKEVSHALGYKDPFFFSRQFGQKLGYPPSNLLHRHSPRR